MAKIGKIPLNMDGQLRRVLLEMKKAIEAATPSHSSVPPGSPTNITITPQPLGNLVDFTAGRGAERHTLLISNSAKWDPTARGTIRVDLGSSSHYSHFVGQGGAQRWYWVIGEHGGGKSEAIGPVSGTTLAYNVAGAIPKHTPLSQDIAQSGQTDLPTVVKPIPTGSKGIND